MAKAKSYELTGIISKIGERESKTASFTARQIVVDVADGNFTQNIPVQFTQDRCDLVDNFSEGQEVTINFNLRGRIWQDKCFGSIEGWRITATATQPALAPNEPEYPTTERTGFVDDNGTPASPSDDLPF